MLACAAFMICLLVKPYLHSLSSLVFSSLPSAALGRSSTLGQFSESTYEASRGCLYVCDTSANRGQYSTVAFKYKGNSVGAPVFLLRPSGGDALQKLN